MIVRVMLALGGLTFVATGLAVFFADACSSVVWGAAGSERAGRFTATCSATLVDGGMSQGVAAAVAFVIGAVLVTVAVVPFFVREAEAA